MIRTFINRDKETAILEEEWNKSYGRLIILYGRRRIGKTRLITEFSKGKPGIMFFAEDTAPRLQIKNMQSESAKFFGDGLLASLDLGSWDQLFSYVAEKVPKNRSYLIIDEFTYLIKNDPSLLSALQKSWDTKLSMSKWCIILCGSMLGLMSDCALSSTSPLYGRRTRDIFLEPLPFLHARKFLSVPFEEALRIYLTIGGVPEYLLKAEDYRSFREFIGREFFDRYGYFYREPYFLLTQEFRELKMYQSILNAVAIGNTAPAAIAQFCGTDARHLYPYLESMARLGIIEREAPLLLKSKNGVYRVKDSLFDFWFNFIFPHRQEIEASGYIPTDPELDTYFGRRYESFVRRDFIPGIFPGYRTGRWWYKEDEIDLVALDKETSSIIFGEVKWGALSRSEVKRIITRLGKKSEKVRHEEYVNEKFMVVAGTIDGKADLLDEGFLVYDMGDIDRLT
jgi:uncharacterized protein